MPTATAAPAPITMLVCALGGEGGGVLAEWLVQAAVRAGYSAQSTSVPGVAQRTGATTYYIELLPLPADRLQGRRPVFSLNPVPGEIDLLLSSELLETARQVGNGMASRERTRIISASGRMLTVAEKMALGDGRMDADALQSVLRRHARRLDMLDLAELARQAGTAVSAVLLGAVAASGVLPIARSVYEDTIRASGKGVDASLRGFALALDALEQRHRAADAAAPAEAGTGARALPVAELRRLARQRLVEYQDEAYARLYDERLARVAAAEAAAAAVPAPTRGAIADEMVRWLALWMAYDDIARVAAAKVSARRMERIRRDTGAEAADLLKVYDHFKPGIPEIAGMLPAPLAERLQAWDRRRIARGLAPWAWPLRLGAHRIRGVLALRALAALARFRRHGSRHAEEQRLIERWLDAVVRATTLHAPLGLELARCGRLVKGYGSTNERGKHNLLHIVEHLAFGCVAPDERAAAVRAAREAALADEAGQAFDKALQAHGAPARPVREQPIRWVRRRPAG